MLSAASAGGSSKSRIIFAWRPVRAFCVPGPFGRNTYEGRRTHAMFLESLRCAQAAWQNCRGDWAAPPGFSAAVGRPGYRGCPEWAFRGGSFPFLNISMRLPEPVKLNFSSPSTYAAAPKFLLSGNGRPLSVHYIVEFFTPSVKSLLQRFHAFGA